MAKNFIKAAIKKPGALRASLGAKKGKPIPAAKLAKAAKAPGKLGQRARFAEVLKGMKKKGGGKPKFADGGEVSNFGKAFRAARKSGADTFDWNGKSYTTEWKEEVAARKGANAGRTTPAAATPSQVKPAASTPPPKPAAASPPPKPASPPPPPPKPAAKVDTSQPGPNYKQPEDALARGARQVGGALKKAAQPLGVKQDSYRKGGKVRRKKYV